MFTVPPARYAAVEMRRRGLAAMAVAALPVLGLVIVALVLDDWRFFLVALMLVFIVWPGLAAFAWLSLMASSDVALRLRPQRWNFNSDGVEIVFCHYDEDCTPAEVVDLPFASVKNFEIKGDYAYFYTRVPTFGAKGEYYIVPASLMPDGLAQRLTDLVYDQQ